MWFVATCRGENVEESFLETARKIYQNIQDGRYLQTKIDLDVS